MELQPITLWGLAGDGLTFAGAIILLKKEFQAIREFKEVEAARRHLARFPAGSFQTKRGETIKNAEDLQTSILNRSSRRARFGAILLTVGFLFLLITRLAENFENSKPHETRGLQDNSALVGVK